MDLLLLYTPVNKNSDGIECADLRDMFYGVDIYGNKREHSMMPMHGML